MSLHERDKILRFAATCIVVSILLLQGSAILFMAVGKPIGSWFWPIIDYPMYSKPHYEGDYIEVYFTLEAEMADGTVANITADDVGLNFWKFYYICNGLKLSKRAAADLLVSLLPNGDSIKEIRVYSPPYRLTKNGSKVVPPKLLNKITM